MRTPANASEENENDFRLLTRRPRRCWLAALLDLRPTAAATSLDDEFVVREKIRALRIKALRPADLARTARPVAADARPHSTETAGATARRPPLRMALRLISTMTGAS